MQAFDGQTSQRFQVETLGRLGYQEALLIQRARHAELVDGREAELPHRLLLVEHPAVITVTRRVGALGHVLLKPDQLARAGVELCETDRGGDVTYHGPGQVVIYPIVDLKRLGIGVHGYIRALEMAAMATCQAWGISCHTERGATGVWTGVESASSGRKIAAIGVRVSRFVTLHGMALNVEPNLLHFAMIIPCGLHGREVTSMRQELGEQSPSSEEVAARLAEEVIRALSAAAITPP